MGFLGLFSPAVFVEYTMYYLTVILQHLMNMGGQKDPFVSVQQSLPFTKTKTLHLYRALQIQNTFTSC